MLMRKNLITLVVMLLAGFIAHAETETVNNYLQKFDNVTVTPSNEFGLKYWNRYCKNQWGSEYKTTYLNPATDGQDGAYLSVSDNNQYDYVISPEVEGNVEFYLRKNNPEGSVDVCKWTKNGNTFTKGDQITVSQDLEGWTKVSVNIEGRGTYIGIRLKNSDLDEFSAEKAYLDNVKALTINSVSTPANSINLNLDANSQTKFTATFDIKNSGTIDLNASDYKIEMYLGTYSELGEKVGEISFDSPLECQQTLSEAKEVTLTIPASECGQSRYIYAVESLGNTKVKVKQGSWDFSGVFKEFLPEPGITITGTVAMKNAYQMGQVSLNESVMKPLTVLNASTATAPLNITDISVEGGFDLEGDKIFTLAPGETKELKLKFSSSETGVHTGKLILYTAELGEKEYPLTVTVLPDGIAKYNFDNVDLPDGFVADASYKIEGLPASLARYEGDSAVSNDEYSVKYLITPKLHFNQGEKLYFEAASKTGVGDIAIYTSADRVNWSEKIVTIDRFQSLPEYKLNLDATESTYRSPCWFTSYVVDMPEGDVYVHFMADRVYIDNIAGGKEIETPVDIFFVSSTIPTEIVANHNMLASLSLRNLGNEIAENTYSVELTIDGKSVAKAAAPSLDKDEAATYEIDYTPNFAGVYEARIVFSLNETVIESIPVTLTVKPESAVEGVMIGDKASTTTSYPLRPYYSSEFTSETVYPASALSNIKKGDILSAITWIGRTYYATFNSAPAKVYLQNTSDGKPGSSFTDLEQMTLVADGEISYDRNLTYDSELGEFAHINFLENFVYTGGGLRVVVIMPAYEYGYNDTFSVDDSYSDACLYTTEYGTGTGYLPVICLHRNLKVPSASGMVKDSATGNAIEGATVTLTSGEVLYRTVSDKDGFWSMEVFQHEKEYTLTSEAPFYFNYTAEQKVSFTDGESQTVNISMTEAKATIFGIVTDGKNPIANASVIITSSDVTETAETDQNGKFSIETREFDRHYTISITSNGYFDYSAEFDMGISDMDMGTITLKSESITITGSVVTNNNPLKDVKVYLSTDGYSDECSTDEKGRFSFSTKVLNSRYTVKTILKDYLEYSLEFDVKEEDIDLGIITLTTGIDSICGDSSFSVYGLKGCIKILSNGSDVSIMDLSGRIVRHIRNLNGEETVDGLAPGIYIVNNIKVIVK